MSEREGLRGEAAPLHVKPSFAGYLEHARVIRVRDALHCLGHVLLFYAMILLKRQWHI